jgi:hypothetical protein
VVAASAATCHPCIHDLECVHRTDMLHLSPCEGGRSVDWDDYFRQEAASYRQLAEKTDDAFTNQELLDLAAVCEEVANDIEDRRVSG